MRVTHTVCNLFFTSHKGYKTTMNAILSNILDSEHIEHANEDNLTGIGNKLLEHSLQYINEVLESAFRSAPEGLKYHGIKPMSPRKVFETEFKSGVNKYGFDLAYNTVYKCELLVTWNGETVPNRSLWLLYSHKGNFVYLSDNKYNLVPILSDKVISVDSNKIFLRLMRDKINIESEAMNIKINGKIQPILLIKNIILRVGKRNLQNKIGELPIPTILYLLIKYGYKEVVRRMCGEYITMDITYGEVEAKQRQIVYEANPTPHKKFKYKSDFKPHGVKIVVNSRRRTASTDVIASSMLYLLNIFSHQARDLVDAINSNDLELEIGVYQLMMGTLVFKDNYNMDRTISEIKEHFKLLDAYVDNVVIKILKSVGVEVSNIFDLLEVVLREFVKRTSDSLNFNIDVTNGYLDVLYYVYFNNIVAINTTIRNVLTSKKELTTKDVEGIFNKFMKPRVILNLAKAGNPLVLKNVDYTGDNYYPKITRDMALQAQGDGVNRSKKPFIYPLRYIYGLDTVTGDILGLQKKCPSPRTNINMYSRIDLDTGKFILDREDEELSTILQYMLDGKLNPNNILGDLNVFNVDPDDVE